MDLLQIVVRRAWQGVARVAPLAVRAVQGAELGPVTQSGAG